MTGVTVTELNIYPVKSMKGISLSSAQLTPLGLANDRRWMVVRDNGKFVTQRDNGRLALVQTALSESGVVLSMPGEPDLDIPFDAPTFGETATDVWGTPLQASDLGDDISQWLTRALQSNIQLRLVRMQEGFSRPQPHPVKFGALTTTLFADAGPYLVAGTGSLEVLNETLSDKGLNQVPMNRFRPNIVLRGLEGFQEHSIKTVRGDTFALEFCGPCERCVVTTIDQKTGERDAAKEPFNTLAGINPMLGNPRAPAFAEYARLDRGDGKPISVGDKLTFE